MNEVLAEIARSQQLMTWGLVFVALLTFVGVVWSVYAAYVISRAILESRRQASDLLREMREDSKRMQCYLFSKLGPADLK